MMSRLTTRYWRSAFGARWSARPKEVARRLAKPWRPNSRFVSYGDYRSIDDLISFDSLTAYGTFGTRLTEDSDGVANFTLAQAQRLILAEGGSVPARG